MGKQSARKLPTKIANRWKEQRIKLSDEDAQWAKVEKKSTYSYKPMIDEPTGRKGKSEKPATVGGAIGKIKKKKAILNATKSWT